MRVMANEGVVQISQNSRTGASPSDCFVLNLGYSLRDIYSSSETEIGEFYSLLSANREAIFIFNGLSLILI